MALPTAVFSAMAFTATVGGGHSLENVAAWAGLWLFLSVANAAWCGLSALNALHRDFRELATLQAAGGPTAPATVAAAR